MGRLNNNRIIGPFHTPYIYVQKRLFVLLLNTPRPSPPPPPIQCWDMKQQLRTKTVKFCPTLIQGEGGGQVQER